MKLRPYQVSIRQACFREWQEVASTLIVCPTGCGKTVIFASVIKNIFPKRVMVIAHRQELIYQARDKIKAVTGLPVEIEMGEFKSSDGRFKKCPVIISTIQTQTSGGDGAGRMGKFDPAEFGLLVIDEAHHACSASYRKVIDYYKTNPKLKILGVTATPDRADEEALGQVFDSVAFDYEILDAINDGWLVPIDQQVVHVSGLDFSSVRTTAGDLNGADLAKVMEKEKMLHAIAGPSIEIISNRRTLCFTSSVKHAHSLAEIFNRHRSGMAAAVDGKTDKNERKQILSEFKRGKIQVVCNCAVLNEGFDDPGVEVIVMARPTKSRSLYAQMCGRSTRPLEEIAHRLNDLPDGGSRREMINFSNKPSCLIVDFVGNSGKHKLMTSADILGGNVSDEAIQSAKLKARKSGKPVKMSELLEEEEKRIQEERRIADEATRAKLLAKAKYTTAKVNPFDILQIQPVKSRGWDHGKELTDKQEKFLLRNGITPTDYSYPECKQLIGEMIGRFSKKLCTLGQAKVLKRFGYDVNVSFDDASRKIDALAKNGWKKPAEQPKEVAAYCGDENDDVPF